MGGYRKRRERMRDDPSNNRFQLLESRGSLYRPPEVRHSLRNYLGQRVECDREKSRNRRSDCQGVRKRNEGVWICPCLSLQSF